MLKIKDDVDLKELEKFGFASDRDIGDGKTYYRSIKSNIYIGKNKIIKKDDGLNWYGYSDCGFYEYEVDLLFDLIRAGLVEKVGDN